MRKTVERWTCDCCREGEVGAVEFKQGIAEYENLLLPVKVCGACEAL